MSALRVVLAEDDFLARRGLCDVIGAEETLELAGVCQSLPELLDTVERARPDVVITGIRMPPTGTDEGIQAAEVFRRTRPRLAVLVLSQYADPGYALALLRAGTRRRGYLLKQHLAGPGQLRKAARMVAGGGSFIDPEVVRAWAAARARHGGSPISLLTGREQQVLAEMANGRNDAAIARSLVISERAVEKHINSIFAKLGVTGDPGAHQRVAAVLAYLDASGPQRADPPSPETKPPPGHPGPARWHGHRTTKALMLTAPGSQPSAAAPGTGELSARERELVTLVAQGHTNAQIAAQLYISVRTVTSHLDRIRDKTGCRRRADLTRLALTTGLV